MSQEITELDERRNKLLDKNGLTNKQAAILAAFEENPQASYADIAELATELLPEGESVTGSYAGEQIKQRRPRWFDDRGNRRRPEDMDTVEPPEKDDLTDEDDDEDMDTSDRVDEEVRALAGDDNGTEVGMEPDETPDETTRDDEETTIDAARVSTLADWYDVSEQKARVMAQAEAQTGIEFSGREGVEEQDLGGVAVGLDEDDWLRLVAFLHLFADTDAGAKHEKRIMEIASNITRQAL